MDSFSTTIFLSGAFMMACIIASMFFYRFSTQTGDRFFRAFALAFFMLGIERIGLVWFNTQFEERTYVYFVRLAAFALIIWAILDKNRPRT